MCSEVNGTSVVRRCAWAEKGKWDGDEDGLKDGCKQRTVNSTHTESDCICNDDYCNGAKDNLSLIHI